MATTSLLPPPNPKGEEPLPLPQKTEAIATEPAASAITTVTNIKLLFKTDLPARKKFVYDAHPCGILLCVRTSSTSPHDSLPGGDAHPREEQCFAWLDNFRAGATAALEHVARYGFPRAGATFLPYSSKAAWAHRHPHAFPHVHCDRLGRVTGFPHWSPRARSALDIPPEVVHLAALPGTTEALAGYEARAAAAGGRFPGGRLRASLGGEKRGGPLGGRLSRAAVLGNAERHQLHLEIYNYFQWLADEVAALETDEGGRRAVKKADLQLHGLRGLVTKMETTFKNVARKKMALDAQGGGESRRPLADPYSPILQQEEEATPAPTPAPLLEDSLVCELAARAADEDEARRAAKARKPSARHGAGEALDFDAMFDKLVSHRNEHGHPNVPVKYPRDPQLGTWVSGLRTKKKALDREAAGAAAPEEGGWSLQHEGDGSAAQASRYLTPERIQRLEALGFAWSLARPKAKAKCWDERLVDLQQWYADHGTFKVPRQESLGEWLHNQRTLYSRRDPKFMTKKAPRLEEIGYTFGAEGNGTVSWDDRFLQLVEFRREFGTFDVPCPEEEGDSEEALEKRRFYKWVSRLHNEYRAYEKGTSSKLNDERVEKLRAINFEFKGPKNRGRPSVSNLALVPKIPWDERIKQLQVFKADTGHLRIDHNYRHHANLGGWAAEISTLYKNWKTGSHLALSEDMIAKFHQLLDLGFGFDILPYYENNRSWEDHYAVLLQYGEEYGGSVRVPLKYKADLRLGKWVQVQRQQYKLLQNGEKSKLTEDRIRKLESVGFEWEVPVYSKHMEEEVQECEMAGEAMHDV